MSYPKKVNQGSIFKILMRKLTGFHQPLDTSRLSICSIDFRDMPAKALGRKWRGNDTINGRRIWQINAVLPQRHLIRALNAIEPVADYWWVNKKAPRVFGVLLPGTIYSSNTISYSRYRFVPLEEVESPTFCSASKRSVQLSYRGMFCWYYTAW